MLKTPKSNNPTQRDSSSALKRARKSVYRQAMLAGLMVVLMVVVLFAITAAWYTNVVQTGNLMFKTKSWGFDGDVQVLSSAIQAAPGDEGIIELTARSKSDSITTVSVTLSNADMVDQMKQRIYFYVDTRKTRNGEQMDRVYLSDTDAYTYTLFPQQDLLLTEQIHNEALLKWHWVYDVLGYYVLGTYQAPGDGGEGGMSITEYLRPIEYDYDEANIEFETGADNVQLGVVTAIDGVSPEEFLFELSKTDGYSGTIGDADADGNYEEDSTEKVGDYYPVDVDENGYGVYAYLCNFSDIQRNTQYDSDLGQKAAEGNSEIYTAHLTISAQNSMIEPVEVSTSGALLNEIDEAADGGTAIIRLADSVTLPDKLVLSKHENVLLDLNGKSLTLPTGGSYNDKDAAVQALEGSSLTIINGDLISGSGHGHVISAKGAEVTLSGVTIANTDCAVGVYDNLGSTDSRIRLVGCNISTTEEAIYVRGNGAATGRQTQLLIENTTLYGGYIGIMGNGTDGQWGTDVQIINSTVGGYWAGIYQPQRQSVTTISNGSTVYGRTAIAVKGGTLNVQDSTVNARNVNPDEDYVVQVPTSVDGSGFWETCAGISVETNYKYEILVNITNGNIISEIGDPIYVYDTEQGAYHKIIVTSGIFDGKDDNYEVPEEYLPVDSEGAVVNETAEDGSTRTYYKVTDTSVTETVPEETESASEEDIEASAFSLRDTTEMEEDVGSEEDLAEDGNVPAFDPSELTEEEVAAILENNAALEGESSSTEQESTTEETSPTTEEQPASEETESTTEEQNASVETESATEEQTTSEEETEPAAEENPESEEVTEPAAEEETIPMEEQTVSPEETTPSPEESSPET